MERAPFSDDERRRRADHAVFDALSQLQSTPAGEAAPLSEDAVTDSVPADDKQHRPINPLLVLLDFLIAFVVTLIVQIPLVVFFLSTRADLRELMEQRNNQALQDALQTPGFFIIATLLQALVFLLVVIVRIVVLNRRGWRWLGVGPGSLSLRSIGWGIIGGGLFLAINIVFGLIAQAVGLQQPDQEKLFPLGGASTLGILTIAFGVVVLAPLSEELFFRAYAQRVFVERYGPAFGIFIGAVLFTLPHLLTISQGFAVLTGAVFAGGAILGWVYWYTRSLTASIIAHAINNAVAFAIILVSPHLEGLQ